MQTSLIRRMLLSISAVPKTAIIVLALAAGFFISGSQVAEADFEPTTTGGLFNAAGSEDGAGAGTCWDLIDNGPDGATDADDPDCQTGQLATSAAADLNTILNIPSGDYNFSAVVTTTPAATTIEPGPGHPSYDYDALNLRATNNEAQADTGGAANCDNGTDDDGDGLIDIADPQCNAQYDPTNSEDGAGANTCNDTVDNGGGDGADEADFPDCFDSMPVLGDIAARLTSDTNLGLNNGACNTNLNVPFTMLNATVDTTATIQPIAQADTGGLGTLENMGTDEGDAPGSGNDPGPQAPANGLPASVDLYPSYLNLIFDGLQPLRRMTGNTIVASSQVTLHFMVFEPGALAAHFDPPHPFSDLDASMGYTSVSILQDPTVPAAPSSITDFCSLLTSNAITLGTTEVNACAGVTTNPCDTTNGIGGPDSAGNDTGRVAQTNPASAGTYLYLNFVQGLRDTDGDGLENAFDSCVFDTNLDGDPRVTNGPDGDMLDSACDPGPNTTVANQDGDGTGSPTRAWNNGGDNCPLLVNADQADFEGLDDDVGGPAYSDSAPRGGPKGDSTGDVCEVDGTLSEDGDDSPNGDDDTCSDTLDNDADTLVDGDDPDCWVGNGPFVVDGQFHTALNVNAQCIGGTDGDGDGWCATGGSQPNDPNDGNDSATPEQYSIVFPLPVAHSGSGVNSTVGGTVSAGLGLDICDADPGPPTGGFHAGCVSPGSNNTGRGQPYQVCNDGIDNDLDTFIDLEEPDGTDADNAPDCEPLGLSPTDTDGDGYSDEAETHIGTDALGRCEVGNTPARSTDWPSDFVSGGFPDSTDKVTITDLTSFLAPVRRLDTSPGNPNFDQRWDLTPGKGFFANWIVINDLTALVAGSSGNPSMDPYNGTRAFGNANPCTAHPVFGD